MLCDCYLQMLVSIFLGIALHIHAHNIARTLKHGGLCLMHLSPETPTPPPPTSGRRGAYVGICKCLDDLPAPRGVGE